MTRTDARYLTRIEHAVEFVGVDTEAGRWGAGRWITQGRARYDGTSDVVVPVVDPAGYSTTLRLSMYDPIEVVAEHRPY